MVTVEEWRRNVGTNINDHQRKLRTHKKNIDDLFALYQKLDDKITVLWRTELKQQILDLLAKEEKHRSQIFIENRITNVTWYEMLRALRELVEEGKLIASLAGKRRMYSVKGLLKVEEK